MYKYRFSLFTSTYNRASMLEKLAEMISKQTFKGKYEWVIVNDGSTDDTVDVVNNIIVSSKIPIKFINFRVNRGKHMAWKKATKVFEGKYVITCDDDDPIALNMLDVFDKYWTQLERSPEYDSFWEVRARGQYENGMLVGEELPKPYFDSDYNEVTFKLKKGCEMGGCRKVEVLRNEASVPEKFIFEEECSNFPEGVRWTNAARKYKTRFVPDITRTYVIGHESLCTTPSGGAKSLKKKYNSLVYALYSLNKQGDLLKKYDFRLYSKTILLLAYSAIRVHKNILSEVEKKCDRILVALAYIPGALIYLIRK